MGSAPSLLSMVRVTSARPSAGLPAVPANTTSSILPPRSGLTPCSPMTQENASTTLDLPDPFGPTTQVMPGSKRSVVADANDLNPRNVRVFRYKSLFSSSLGAPGASHPHLTVRSAATRGSEAANAEAMTARQRADRSDTRERQVSAGS